jgi:Na+-transporting NADH:ubiquinone oxidoreductase subunit NqrF
VRGTQARSRLLLVRVVFGVRGVGDAPDGQMESCVWSHYPTHKIRGIGPWYGKYGTEKEFVDYTQR